MDKWLDRLDRLLVIIRPKSYNLFAKSVIGLGLILVADSQLNLSQVILIALYEHFFGYSEVLRDLIGKNTSNLWTGPLLIFGGMTYHYLVTTGEKLVNLSVDGVYYVPDTANDHTGGNLNAGILFEVGMVSINIGYHSFTSSTYFGIGGSF